MEKYEIVRFKNQSLELDVEISPTEDTVWLSKEQMALLFDRDRSVISRHIKHIFDENELDEKSNVRFLHIAYSDKSDFNHNKNWPIQNREYLQRWTNLDKRLKR